VSPIVMSISATDAEPVVRGDLRRKPVALEAFRDVVHQVLAGAAR
jgi:hypothetical protein